MSDNPNAGRPNPESMKILYEHVKSLLAGDAKNHASYRAKVEKFLTIHIFLFAGIAFGLKQLDNQPTVSMFTLYLAVLASITVAAAFIVGIRCNHIQDRPVAGANVLLDVLKTQKHLDSLPEVVHHNLATNLATELAQSRQSDQKRAGLGKTLNWLTSLGFTLVAFFVFMATAARLF